jgi:DNA repair protein SbcD/Mre11
LPIRILHFSDAHIGVETYGRIDPSTGLNSRLLDFTAALDETVDRAVAGDVDLVLFTGDAYRNRDPNPTHQREFARRIHRLSRAGVPVYLLVGNHDLPAATGRANSVDIFETLEVPGVYVGREPRTTVVETRNGPIQIVGLPWITRSLLIAKTGQRDLTQEGLKDTLGNFMAGFVQRAAEALDPSMPAVLCAHLIVMGARYGSEQTAMLGQDVILPRSAIALPAFDYVALGHVHRHQTVSSELPLALYSGSLERVDFGEEDEAKGYVLVDVAKGRATYEFKEVKARRFLTLRIDARDADPTAATLAEIDRRLVEVSGAVIRLEITTTPEREATIDYGAIRVALEPAYHVAGIAKRIEREHRLRVPDIAELTPLEALRAYLRSKETPADRAAALIERGARLIAEVDGVADANATADSGSPFFQGEGGQGVRSGPDLPRGIGGQDARSADGPTTDIFGGAS